MPRAAAPPASRCPGPARRALREATDAIHGRLHGVPRLRRLAQGDLAPAEYAALLLDYLRFHRAVEDRLARGPDLAPLGIDIRARRQSPLLLDDLAALGVPAPAAAPPGGLAVPASVPAALGYLYVTEGSRLGGRVLARGLAGTLAPGMPGGRSFLLGGARPRGQGWADLCAALEAAGRTAAARAAMAEAAIAAFAAFESSLAPAAPTALPSRGTPPP